MIGTYSCTCHKGYRKKGTTCEEVKVLALDVDGSSQVGHVFSLNGNNEETECFEAKGVTDTSDTCPLSWKNKFYILGGADWTSPQISRLVNGLD